MANISFPFLRLAYLLANPQTLNRSRHFPFYLLPTKKAVSQLLFPTLLREKKNNYESETTLHNFTLSLYYEKWDICGTSFNFRIFFLFLPCNTCYIFLHCLSQYPVAIDISSHFFLCSSLNVIIFCSNGSYSPIILSFSAIPILY